MPDWGFLGIVLSSTVVVELIRGASVGLGNRRRAKGEKRTRLEIALTSRWRWITHAQHLRSLWWDDPRPDLPDEPDDPWPPNERE